VTTAAQFRKLALALPEVQEKSHFGQPDFRVRNKIFADLSPDGKWGTLKLVPEVQLMLLDAKPDAFTPAAGAWGRGGWTRVTLAAIEAGALAELLHDAYCLVAPKTLAAAISGEKNVQRPKLKRAARR
jgi:hypothetical protein